METCENDQGKKDLNILKRVFPSTVVTQGRFPSARERERERESGSRALHVSK
jgi:hypothetical protein